LGFCKESEARKKTHHIAEYLPVDVEGGFGGGGRRTYGLHSIGLGLFELTGVSGGDGGVAKWVELQPGTEIRSSTGRRII